MSDEDYQVAMKPPLPPGGLQKKKKAWNHQEKKIKIDVNRYRAKYDFDVAKRICPFNGGVQYNDEFQDFYKNNAYLEILQECSNKFSDGKKLYQSLYTFEGQFIPSLDEIPKGCKLVLVSEKDPPLP
jgi:hypothetical protein